MPASLAASRSPVETAMLWMVAAMVLVPALDAIAKHLTATLVPAQVAWARFAFQVLFMAPLVVGRPLTVARRDLGLHAVRGVLLALATLCFFAAIQVMPLADAVAIFFVEPLLLSLLAGLVLREGIGWRRIVAILVGFAGALLIVRPSFASFGWTATLPLLAGLLFAFYLVATRVLAPRTDANLLQFTAGLGGLACMTAVVALGMALGVPALTPVPPDILGWTWLALLGLVATASHLMMVHAFKHAPATVLAPLQYLEIGAAVAWGYLVFGDFPGPLTWLGIAVIVASGLYVFHRERRRGVPSSA